MIEGKATIESIQMSFPERMTILTISIKDVPPSALEPLKDKLLSFVLKPFKQKRSLDANGYYWKLCTEIAKVRNISKTEMHNILLSEYGTERITPDGAIEWAIKSLDYDWTKSTTEHYRPAEYRIKCEGAWFPVYWCLKGSHEYDTAEMAKLIDGTVYEAKEHGIETLTPDELARLKAAWKGGSANDKN